MIDLTVTTSEAARCLAVLHEADKPMTAADIAARLILKGCRETRRRRVRAIIQTLREEGQWIVACNADGYWLTCEESIWNDYNEGRQIEAKRVLGTAHRRQI